MRLTLFEAKEGLIITESFVFETSALYPKNLNASKLRYDI